MGSTCLLTWSPTISLISSHFQTIDSWKLHNYLSNNRSEYLYSQHVFSVVPLLKNRTCAQRYARSTIAQQLWSTVESSTRAIRFVLSSVLCSTFFCDVWCILHLSNILVYSCRLDNHHNRHQESRPCVAALVAARAADHVPTSCS